MPINYSKYPDNWLSEIRPRILKRANNTCECEGCDFKHGQTVYSVMMPGNKREWRATEAAAIKLAKLVGWEPPFNYPILKPVKVVLTIAHLDHDETNLNVTDDRLMAMCQYHHLRYDAKEKYRRVMGL